MEYNVKKLVTDIKHIEAKIRTTKLALRTTWTKPMKKDQYALFDLKHKVTILYAIRANINNKQHCTNYPLHAYANTMNEYAVRQRGFVKRVATLVHDILFT